MFREPGDMAVCYDKLFNLVIKNLILKSLEFDQGKLEALG